ncbi:hypothetical protein QVD17_23439 [Tagetes erecta]|uniref:Uncharacterized protein n=1 Tax=Tagetes erecta TaxID=13708 RepID=A0AAD8KE43_TARER|nr:hypothetical protein QVD17_23439 [Tagetes erecta]
MEEGRYAQNHQDDEVIDTLSLSDFMIYDNNGDPQDFYRLNEQLDDPSDFDDQFEFSSELLKTSVTNSVVFCGKIIPYKESINVSPHKMESKKLRKSHKFVGFFKKSRKPKSHIYSEKLDLKYEVPRWYLFMFGFGSNSFSAQMHIRDLKKRQTSMGKKDRIDHGKKSGGNDGGIGSWSLLRFLGCGGGGGRGGDNHLPMIIKKLE